MDNYLCLLTWSIILFNLLKVKYSRGCLQHSTLWNLVFFRHNLCLIFYLLVFSLFWWFYISIILLMINYSYVETISSWSPAGAIRAGWNPATYRYQGEIIHVEGEMSSIRTISMPWRIMISSYVSLYVFGLLQPKFNSYSSPMILHTSFPKFLLLYPKVTSNHSWATNIGGGFHLCAFALLKIF